MKKINLLIPTGLLSLASPLVSLSSCSVSNITLSKKITVDTTTNNTLAYQIIDAVKNTANQDFELVESDKEEGIVLDVNNETIKSMTEQLSESSYQIKVKDNKVYIAANSGIARTCAVERLLKDYLNDKGFNIPSNLDVKGECKASDYITELYNPNIVTPGIEINKYRDPFIYRDGSEYYMVATGTTTKSTLVGDDWWHLWKASGDFKDSNTKWNDLGYVIDDTIEHAELIKGDRWAPELYKYTNPDTKETAFYIFTTFATKETENEPARGRGCAVFKSNKLLNDDGTAAKFQLISYYDKESNIGRITNPNQSCIDGHLYIEDNKPYMVFVQEFTDFSPQNGRMFVAQMSNDLTHFVTEAKEIFKATDAPWVSQEEIQTGQFRVTDGPFIHKMSNGQLVMLWSSYFDAASKQYCMGYATADSVMGPWTQHRRLIYDEYMLEGYKSPFKDVPEDFSLQGGHGMIFTDTNDKMYMCVHCGSWDKKEHPFILPIKEANGLLVWDLY